MYKPDSHFYLPVLSVGEHVLDAEESLHAVKVCRAAPGDTLELCDGLGHFALGTITVANPKECRVAVAAVTTSPQARPALHLALACLKDDDIEDVVFHCAQLEIASITLLRTEHSLEPRKSDLERTLRRCQAKSLVSLKQSRKPWLTVIQGPVYLADWLKTASGDLIVCDPEGAVRAPEGYGSMASATLLVGPEGGFSVTELAQLRGGNGATRTHLLGLGPTRLRAVTAPLFALGVLAAR
jgi:16S rRNA (uracil1498-N3)-methyltransferase